MYVRETETTKRKVSWLASSLLCSFLTTAFLLADARPASALPLVTAKVHPLPAFARKYGMPCSSCHEAWPKLSPFGQSFKDNGYQMGNDRDAPIFQSPAYWPVTFRMTPQWHRETTDRVGVDGPVVGGVLTTAEKRVTTHGFDWSGLDFHTAGTLAKNFSFYLLPASDNAGSFHFEAIWARLDNLLGSSWLNIKLGKFELDNLHSEKRILTLSSNGGLYHNYHFQPMVSPGMGESLYTFGIGDNQVGAEWMGHSKNDRTRISAAVLSSNDGSPGLPTSRGYDTFVAASQAFEAGSLGLQRVGVFGYFGQAPTYFQYTQTTTTTVGTDVNNNPVTNTTTSPVAGTGIGNKGFYRAGFIGMWYVKKLDVTSIYFRGWDNVFLGTNTPANQPLPTGARAPMWNGGLIETHYNINPTILLLNRYELVRMDRQTFASNPSNLGDLDALTFGFRYYPFISSRAGFAFHNEFSVVRQRGAAPVSGLDVTSKSYLAGFDFAF